MLIDSINAFKDTPTKSSAKKISDHIYDAMKTKEFQSLPIELIYQIIDENQNLSPELCEDLINNISKEQSISKENFRERFFFGNKSNSEEFDKRELMLQSLMDIIVSQQVKIKELENICNSNRSEIGKITSRICEGSHNTSFIGSEVSSIAEKDSFFLKVQSMEEEISKQKSMISGLQDLLFDDLYCGKDKAYEEGDLCDSTAVKNDQNEEVTNRTSTDENLKMSDLNQDNLYPSKNYSDDNSNIIRPKIFKMVHENKRVSKYNVSSEYASYKDEEVKNVDKTNKRVGINDKNVFGFTADVKHSPIKPYESRKETNIDYFQHMCYDDDFDDRREYSYNESTVSTDGVIGLPQDEIINFNIARNYYYESEQSDKFKREDDELRSQNSKNIGLNHNNGIFDNQSGGLNSSDSKIVGLNHSTNQYSKFNDDYKKFTDDNSDKRNTSSTSNDRDNLVNGNLTNFKKEGSLYSPVSMNEKIGRIDEKMVDASSFGHTIFSICKEGDLEAMKSLVEANPSVVRSQDQKLHWYPIHFAAYKGCSEICEYLLSKGAEIGQLTPKNYTPLLLSCMKKHDNLSKLLIEKGANVNDQSFNGWTPLLYSTTQGSVEMVRLLLDRGADVSVTNAKGWNAIRYSCLFNNIEIAKILLEKGASVSEQDSRGYTPLHIAAAKGYLDLSLLLVENGASVTQRDVGLWTPIDFASFYGHKELLVKLKSIKKSQNEY